MYSFNISLWYLKIENLNDSEVKKLVDGKYPPITQNRCYISNYFKSILGALNFYELEGGLLIQNLKKNDPKARRIARNYANMHPIKSRDTVFLKVYHDNSRLRETEIKTLNLLINNGIRVPQWYCHGNISPGLDFALIERIKGEQIPKILSKKPKNKNEILKSVVDELVKIHKVTIPNHLYEHSSLHKSDSLDKKMYYIKRFKEAFLDKFDNTSTTYLTELFTPISTEISKLKEGTYIDANPSNILIDKDMNVYNVDFENVKRLPYQFDLSILAAGLGLSDKEQTEIIDYYLEQKFKSRKIKLSQRGRRKFHKGYNLVNILRNLTLAGNMQDYIEKYGELQALKDQKRYFKQAKKAIQRALDSEYMTKKDKIMIEHFKKEFDTYKITYTKVN